MATSQGAKNPSRQSRFLILMPLPTAYNSIQKAVIPRRFCVSDAASVTIWIHQLRTGNSLAAQKLWEAYFHRLVALARGKLRTMPRRGARA